MRSLQVCRTVALGAFLLWTLYPACLAQGAKRWEVFIPRQVTTHPSDDYEPALSADGRWLVFTSDRNGNEDIFLKSTSGGGDSLVTGHSSADYHPFLSPEGKTVAYVSRRDDALGDIYLQERSSGKTRRLTTYKGYDDLPRFSPEGETILFVSDRETGLPNLWLMSSQGEVGGPLTTCGATDPCWSPDGSSIAFISLSPEPQRNNRLSLYFFSDSSTSVVDTGPGVDAFPCFLPDGDQIVFTKFGMDTNGDGLLNTDDTPCLCKINLKTNSLQQLTFSEHWEYMPACPRAGAEVFYLSNKGGNFDVYSIPSQGIFPEAKNGKEQLQLASWAEANLLGREAPYLRILAYQAVAGFHPQDDTACALAGLKLGSLYKGLGYVKQAEQVWTQTVRRYPGQRTISGLCQIALANSRAQSFWHLDRRKSLREALTGLEKVKESYPEDRLVLAAAHKSNGDWLRDYGDMGRALHRYQQVKELFPEQTDIVAEAEFRRAQIRSRMRVADPFEEVGSYLQLVDRYEGRSVWADSARVAIVQLFAEQELDKRLASLNRLFYTYRERGGLAALTLLEMARALAAEGKPSLAVDVYQRLISSYPEEERTLQVGRYELAKLYLSLSQTQEATSLLSELYRHSDRIESASLRYHVKRELSNSLLSEAEALFSESNYQQARNSFGKIISLNYDNIKSHWGWIKSAAALGELQTCEKSYREKLKDEPDNEVARYGLAVTLCFRFCEEGKSEYLRSARRQLEQVLGNDYGFVEAYLTLGWVYCQLQATGEAQKEERLYEAAIDLATMGITLNDESENPSLEADLHLNAAEALLHIEQYASALQHYLEKLHLDPRFPDEQTRKLVVSNLARAARNADRFDLSANNYQKVLQTAEELEDSELKLQIYEELGLVYHMAGDYELSNQFFSRAIEYRRASGPLGRLAHLHQAMAFNYQMLEQVQDAIRYTTIADSLFSLVPRGEDVKKENALKVTTPLFSFNLPLVRLEEIKIGGSLYPRGFPLAAEGWLSTSIEAEAENLDQDFWGGIEALKEKLARVRKEKERALEAVTLNNLGYQYLLIGEYDSCLACFSASWELAEKLKLLSGMVANALSYSDIGLFLLHGEIDNSPPGGSPPAQRMESIERILSKTLEQLDPFRTRPRSLLLANLGGLSYLKALGKINTDRYPETSKDFASFLESPHPGLEEMLASEQHYLGALEAAKECKYWPAIGQISYNLGCIYRLLGRFDSAKVLLRKSLEIGSRYYLGSLLWESEQALALLEWERGSPADSIEAYFRKGLEVLENSPVEQRRILAQPSLWKRKRDFYRDYLKFKIQKGDYREAFNLLERERAKYGIDLLATYDFAELKKERHKIYLRDARYLQAQIDKTRSRILREQLRGSSADPEKLASLRGELSTWESEYQKLKTRIEQEGPELASMILVEPAPIETLQQALSHGRALLNYAVVPEGLGIWVLTSSELRFRFAPVKEKTLSRLVERYCRLLRCPPTKEIETVITKQARRLYSLLIGPVEALIGDRSELIIIPDQSLSYLPFASLLSPDGYLVELFDLTVCPSADFYYQSYRRLSPNQRGTYLLPLLSGAEAEADSLRKSCPRLSIDSPPPSPKDLKHTIADYGRVHLCGGIDFNPGYPLGSSFSYGATGDSEYTVSFHDLYSWDLGGSLLSVSGNEVQFDPHHPGRENLAFALSFGYAGVGSIVTSLWRVDPRPRAEFFKLFYQGLQKYNVSCALTEAQLQLKQRYPEPHYWAAFENLGFAGLDPREAREVASQKLATLLARAQGYASRGEWLLSAKSYRAALNLAYQLELPADKIERLLSGVVLSYFRAGDFRRASEWQQKTLELGYGLGDSSLVGKSLLGLRQISYQAGDYRKASFYESEYRKSQIGPGQRREQGVSLRNQANFTDLSGDYKSARIFADSAVALFQPLDDSLNLAETYLLLGRININCGDFNSAVRSLSQAVELSGERARDLQARALQLLGFAYMKLGDLHNALISERRCLVLLSGGDRTADLARACQYLASIYWYLGDYGSAKRYQQRSWKLYHQLGDTRGRLESLNIRGLIERYRGDTESSFSTNRWGVALADSLGLTSHKATFLNNLGNLFCQERNFKESLIHYKLAHNLDRQSQDREAMLVDLRNIGLAHQGLGELDSAVVYLQKGLQQAEDLKDLEMIVKMTYHLGHLYLLQGKDKEGGELLTRAAQLSEGIKLDEVLWRAHYRLGELHRKRDRLEQAEDHFQTAFEIIRSSLPQDPVEARKGGYLEDKSDLYRALMATLMESGKAQKALGYAELIRNRNFADRLAQRRIDFKKENSKAAFEKLQTLKQKVIQERGTLSSLLVGKDLTDLPPGRLDSTVEGVKRAEAGYRSFFDSLMMANRGFALFFHGGKPNLELLADKLGDNRAAMYYFCTPEALYCWAVIREGIETLQVPISERELKEKVERFRGQIRSLSEVETSARRLYDLLVKPLESAIASKKELIVIPWGSLFYLPFGIMIDGEGEYLGRNWQLSYLPSLSYLYLEPLPTGHFPEGMVFVPESRSNPMGIEEDRGLSSLFCEELRRISLPEELEADIGTVRYFHLASSAKLEPERPFDSGASLPDTRLSLLDLLGFSMESEVFSWVNLDFPYILSLEGFEVELLWRLLLSFHCDTALLAQWSPELVGRAIFLKRFYRWLLEGKTTPAAFALAQLKIEQSYNPHPNFWGAYYVVGAP